MSTDIVKASVTPPPTKRELLQAAAQVIAAENKVKNQKRRDRIDAAFEAFSKAVRKEAKKHVGKFINDADVGTSWSYKPGDPWIATVKVEVPIEGKLIELLKERTEAKLAPVLEENPNEVLKELRAASAGHTPENLRVSSILATPALRKAVKEFGEKLLATPTAQDKAAAIEVGGAR